MTEHMSRIEIQTIVPNQSEQLREEFVKYEKGDKKGLILREEVIKQNPLRLAIPISYLHGTQRAEGFTSARAKRAEKALKNGGLAFMIENPVIVAVDFANDYAITYVEDGHHRSMKSPIVGIREIPSLVLPIETFAKAKIEALLRISKLPGERLDKNEIEIYKNPQLVARKLENEAIDAFYSFRQKGITQNNQIIRGVKNLEELSLKFKHF